DIAVVHGDCVDLCSVMEWTVPARVDGVWQLPDGTLTLSQTFQKIAGTLVTGGTTTAIRDGRLAADQIGFSAAGGVYQGRVSGASMSGTVMKNGRTVPWTGTRRSPVTAH